MNALPSQRFAMACKAFQCVIWAAIGIACSEMFVRTMVPFSLYYDTWFESGIHQSDEELGFVYKPNYRGAMQHRDRCWRVPLALDQRGFRMPASTAKVVGTPSKDAVLLGGHSMMFSYGLPDGLTVADQIAEASPVSLNVYTVSQPGVDIGRDFYKYKRFLENDVQSAIVIVGIYSPKDCVLLTQAYSVKPSKPTEDLFRFHESLVISRPGFSGRMGRPLLRSYVFAGGCRIIDEFLDALTPGTLTPVTLANKKPLQYQSKPRSASRDAATMRPEQTSLVAELTKHFAERKADLVFVLMPSQGSRIPEEAISPLMEEHVTILDLRDLLNHQGDDWIASGHYGPNSARFVGQAIADEIQNSILSRKPFDVMDQ